MSKHMSLIGHRDDDLVQNILEHAVNIFLTEPGKQEAVNDFFLLKSYAELLSNKGQWSSFKILFELAQDIFENHEDTFDVFKILSFMSLNIRFVGENNDLNDTLFNKALEKVNLVEFDNILNVLNSLSNAQLTQDQLDRTK